MGKRERRLRYKAHLCSFSTKLQRPCLFPPYPQNQFQFRKVKMLTNFLGAEAASISHFTINGELPSPLLKIPSMSSFPFILPSNSSRSRISVIRTPNSSTSRSSGASAQVEQQNEVETEAEVAEGYTITQFCDKIIDLFLYEKPKSKEWRKYLIFRQDWKKYSDCFYNRCQARADAENNSESKQQLIALARKVKRIDDEMERHHVLFQEIVDSPMDINAIVARRRKDFTGDFFRHLTLIQETNNNLEDCDAVARLGARCLSAVSAYDKTLENVETLDAAQAKFDDILNSPSVDVACEKIKSLAKAKELDSSLVLLINSAWASAKESSTMRNEVKDIMYRLYKATKSSLKSIAPKEIKLLKYLLNITDPEERFSALATAFSPGDDQQARDPTALYTTPKELHKWVKIMLDAYHLNSEDTDIREAKQLTPPIVIQRLFILKETIEEEYLDQSDKAPKEPKDEE